MGTIYKSKAFEVRLPIADQDVPFTGLSFNGQKIESFKQLDVQFTQGENIFDGKIIRAEAEVDPLTRMLSVVAQINNDVSNNIVVGQFVQAIIYGNEISDVTFYQDHRFGNESIWVIDEDLKLFNRAVEIINI